ncbi:MAG: 4Fe-4S dicluster domain-containing protein [Pseudomonadota bacterium]
MTLSILLKALRADAFRRVNEISGQNIYQCMQCGTCSSVCPMSGDMEITPRQAMLMMQHGMIDEVADSRTPWLCASCHSCQVRCPRGIEVPRVMEALRQLTLRDNVDRINPRTIPQDQVKTLPQIALVAGFRKMTA